MAPPATEPFPFPREYHFPPFFTRQTNLTTRHAQLVKWSALVLSYCRHHRIFRLPLSSAVAGYDADIASTSGGERNAAAASASASAAAAGGNDGGGVEELFHNRELNRRLSPADVREVVEFMRKDGRAEYVGGGNKESGDVVWVYWRSPEEWAALIEAWVDETAQKGTVLTLYELTEGDGTRGTEFHGMDADLLQKALQVLVKRGKAQIFGQEDSQGVKFF